MHLFPINLCLRGPDQYEEALQRVHPCAKGIRKTPGYLMVHLKSVAEHLLTDQHDCYRVTGFHKNLNALT